MRGRHVNGCAGSEDVEGATVIFLDKRSVKSEGVSINSAETNRSTHRKSNGERRRCDKDVNENCRTSIWDSAKVSNRRRRRQRGISAEELSKTPVKKKIMKRQSKTQTQKYKTRNGHASFFMSQDERINTSK